MKPTYTIINDDCLQALKDIPDNSIDAVLTDPPYGIAFMNKRWDYEVPSVQIWQEVLRTLKPGAHALVACGTRTQHRMATNLELAGFEIRDIITWLYGSGFPKSHNVSQAIDEHLNQPRTITHSRTKAGDIKSGNFGAGGNQKGLKTQIDYTAPTSPEAHLFNGYGTALKPASELFTLVRKPLSEPTIAQNVLKHSTGSLNIDATRIPTASPEDTAKRQSSWSAHEHSKTFHGKPYKDLSGIEANPLGRFPSNVILSHHPLCKVVDTPSTPSYTKRIRGRDSQHISQLKGQFSVSEGNPLGRFPSNVILSHHNDCKESCHPDCPVHILDTQSGTIRSGGSGKTHDRSDPVTSPFGSGKPSADISDEGTASRFFKTLDGCHPDCPIRILDEQSGITKSNDCGTTHATTDAWGTHPERKSSSYQGDEGTASRFFYTPKPSPNEKSLGLQTPNSHPTVKSIELMRYLSKLITPPTTPEYTPTILDPFTGSGTTGCAAAIEGVSFIGMELEESYANVAAQRITYYRKHRHHFMQTNPETGKQLKTSEASAKAEATPKFKKALFGVP